MKTDIADLRLLLGRDVVDHLAAHVVGADERHRAETKSRVELGRGRREEEEEESGVGEGGEWLEGDWVTPKTVEGLNELWEEQKIRASFADAKHLTLEDGNIIPFDPRFRLCAVTLVSANDMCREMVNNIAPKKQAHICNVGFHNIKSTSYVADSRRLKPAS